jgi:malic enzyme
MLFHYATKDKEEIIRFVKAIQPVFGAVNIEDIESPKVLEIVERLLSNLFHNDFWFCFSSRYGTNQYNRQN